MSCKTGKTLKGLHWLPVKYRIEYKINLLTFKVLAETAPQDIIEEYMPERDREREGERE